MHIGLSKFSLSSILAARIQLLSDVIEERFLVTQSTNQGTSHAADMVSTLVFQKIEGDKHPNTTLGN